MKKEMHTVAFINKMIRTGHASEMILVTEAIQEKKIARIAEDISSHPEIKFVLLAGPSSSGKTSASKRLCIQLMSCFKHPVALSTDNWFLDRDNTPLDEYGKRDYESIEAMDLKQFNEDLLNLLCGRRILLPTFNFRTGKREYLGERLQLTPDMLLVIEGIHALNPQLTAGIDESNKYKIFVSPETPISLDGEHWVPTTVNRLLRRISRDYQSRGKSALESISSWESVKRGEKKWIFPYKNDANVCIDTSMLYELAALRPKAEPVLQAVPQNAEHYDIVKRLLNFLSEFDEIGSEQIPRNSLMREFVGGSFFKL